MAHGDPRDGLVLVLHITREELIERYMVDPKISLVGETGRKSAAAIMIKPIQPHCHYCLTIHALLIGEYYNGNRSTLIPGHQTTWSDGPN